MTLTSKTLALLALGLSGLALAAPPVRDYAATISPTSVAAGSITSPFTVVITNCGSGTAVLCGSIVSTQEIGSATIVIPAGFIVDSNSLGVSASGGLTWSGTISGSTIILGAGPQSGGTQKLPPGGSVTVTFNATAPCTAADYTWNTAAYQDTLADDGSVQTGTPFALANPPQPKVTVTGQCQQQQLTGYCTSSQGGYGQDPNGSNTGQLLANAFPGVFPSGVQVGSPNSMSFSSSAAINAYLPAGGKPGTLSTNYVDPTSTSSGVFGAQVLTLRLTLGLQSFFPGFTQSINSLKLTGTGTSLDGSTVAQIEAAGETALGGGSLPNGFTVSSLETLIDLINNSFEKCTASSWASTHLVP
jgi:hypothetical protein